MICLWGPDHRGGGDRFDALGRLARRAAQDLSRAWHGEVAVLGAHPEAGDMHPAPDVNGGRGQLAQVGRSGNPARPVASVFTASTWCSWIPPRSNWSRDPAM